MKKTEVKKYVLSYEFELNRVLDNEALSPLNLI